MKRVIVVPLSLLLLLFLLSPAYALNHDLLTNISYSYYAGFSIVPGDGSGTQAYSESHSQSGIGEGPHVVYSYNAPADSDPTSFKAEIYPYRVLVEKWTWEFDDGAIEAWGEWKFIPKYDHVKVNLEGYAYCAIAGAGTSKSGFGYSLYDFTDDRSITDISREVLTLDYAEDFLSEYHILEKDHIYGLRLAGYGEWCDGALAKASANFSVPEPGTMFLVGSGLFGLIGRRRKRSK